MPILDPGIKLIKLEGLNLFETFSFRDRLLKLWNKKNKDILDYYDFFKTLIGGFPEMYSFGERAKKYLSQKKDYDIIIDNQSLSSGILEIQKYYPFELCILDSWYFGAAGVKCLSLLAAGNKSKASPWLLLQGFPT